MKKLTLFSVLCSALLADGISSFMPDITLTVDTAYVNRNKSDDTVSHLEIPSVAHGMLGKHSHGAHEHASYNAKNGFNLNYGELGISSSVDPIFTLDAVFHFSEHDSEIEELYFTSNVLGDGLRLKGGKFLSNFGYLNEHHHHAWDFADMPLVYEAFLGMHGLNDKGLQLQYTLPTPFYLMAGVELLQGDNEGMFGYDSISIEGKKVANAKKAPSLYVGYLKSSFDIGDTTLYGGVSYAKGSSRIDHSDDHDHPHAFSGDAELYGVDFMLLHQLGSYSNIKWQNELLYRKLDGNSHSATKSTPVVKKQAGIYSQLTYKHDASWAMGVRYDGIIKNSVYKNASKSAQPSGLNRYSAMVEYSVSEFAKIRAQFNHDRSMFDDDKRVDVNSFILQANFTIGAHGAHGF